MNAQATEGWALQLSDLLTDLGRSELPEAVTKAAKTGCCMLSVYVSPTACCRRQR